MPPSTCRPVGGLSGKQFPKLFVAKVQMLSKAVPNCGPHSTGAQVWFKQFEVRLGQSSIVTQGRSQTCVPRSLSRTQLSGHPQSASPVQLANSLSCFSGEVEQAVAPEAEPVEAAFAPEVPEPEEELTEPEDGLPVPLLEEVPDIDDDPPPEVSPDPPWVPPLPVAEERPSDVDAESPVASKHPVLAKTTATAMVTSRRLQPSAWHATWRQAVDVELSTRFH